MQKRRDLLISKKRSTNYNYIGLQMLYRRLPDGHAMKNVMHSKMLSAKAGIIGESALEKIFESYQFPFSFFLFPSVYCMMLV